MLCYSFCASLHHPELGQGLNMNTAIIQVAWFVSTQDPFEASFELTIFEQDLEVEVQKSKAKKAQSQNCVKKFWP